MSALAELVVARRHQLKLSVRQAAEKSGGMVSPSRLSAIENGGLRVSDRILEGIAAALDLPLTKVRAAAGRDSRAPLPPFVLPDRASELNARERRLVLTMVDTLLAAHRDRP